MVPQQDANQGQVPNPVQVQKFLRGIDYPADKQTLLETARREGADAQVLQALERLPDVTYSSPNDVSEQLAKLQ